MIYNSKGFTFNGQTINDFQTIDGEPIKLLNVVLNSNMYTESLSGSRTIKEVQIPGRKNPYLYHIDEAPLQFSLTVAFETPVEIVDARKIARWLLTPRIYKQLTFDQDLNKVYYTVFTGEPKYTYVGSKRIINKTITHVNGVETNETILQEIKGNPQVVGGNYTYNSDTQIITINASEPDAKYHIRYELFDPKTVGYIEVTARCNAPTAYTAAKAESLDVIGKGTNPMSFTINNDGDDYTYPDLTITLPATLPNIDGKTAYRVQIENKTNGSVFAIENVQPNEVIAVDSELKTITSTVQSTYPAYPRWNRDHLILEIDANNIEVSLWDNSNQKIDVTNAFDTQIDITITHKAPRLL